MTRPVADILAEAERDGWPTSLIDAMANHHLCGGLTREHGDDCSTEGTNDHEVRRGDGGGRVVPGISRDGDEVASPVRKHA